MTRNELILKLQLEVTHLSEQLIWALATDARDDALAISKRRIGLQKQILMLELKNRGIGA